MSAEASKSAVKKENHRKARRRKESRGRRAIMKGSLRWVKRKTTGAIGLGEFVTWVLERGSNRTGRDGMARAAWMYEPAVWASTQSKRPASVRGFPKAKGRVLNRNAGARLQYMQSRLGIVKGSVYR